MAFMRPQIIRDSMWQVDTTCGTELVPADVVGNAPNLADYIEGELTGEKPELVTGFFARLSAPGYMDCTDWSGPFETEQAARDYIESTYDVDADTGEELNDYNEQHDNP